MTLNHEVEVRTLEGEPNENFQRLILISMPSWIDLPNYDNAEIPMSFSLWWRIYDPIHTVDHMLEVIKWYQWLDQPEIK